MLNFFFSKKPKSIGEQKEEKEKIVPLTKSEMLINTSVSDPLSAKSVIGPMFFFGGVFGAFKGFFQSKNVIKGLRGPEGFPKRFLVSSVINKVSEQSLRYANAAGGLGLVYCMSRKGLNFLFEEQMKKMSNVKRNTIYGFTAGIIYKSTRGLAPALLGGFLMGNCCLFLTYYKNRKNDKIN